MSYSLVLLFNLLDDTDGDGLLHISDGVSTKRGIFLEDFDAKRLGGDKGNQGSITVLDELGVFFLRLTSSSVDLVVDGFELASNVSSVAIQNGGVTSLDLTGVIHDDNLGVEGGSFFGGVVLGIGSDITSSDILDGDTLNVETDVVTGDGFLELFVMHFDGLAFSDDLVGGELDGHTGLDDTSFDSTDGDGTDTTDLVDVLEGKSEGLVDGSFGGFKSIESFDEDGSLVPGAVGGSFQHIVTIETRDGDEGDGFGLVTDLLQVVRQFLLDFSVSFFREVDGLFVHLVEADDHLLDTQSEGQESVFSGLTILGDTSFEFTLGGSNHKNSNISLGGTSNHILDEISVTGGIDDGEVIFSSFELPEGNIDGDTSFSFSFKLVQNPSVLERTLTSFSGFLFELFDDSLIDTTALVDQVTGSGRFTRIDVTDNDQVNVNLITSSHFE